MRVFDQQEVTVDGKPVVQEEEFILLAVNKPVGVVCTTTSRFQEKNHMKMPQSFTLEKTWGTPFSTLFTVLLLNFVLPPNFAFPLILNLSLP